MERKNSGEGEKREGRGQRRKNQRASHFTLPLTSSSPNKGGGVVSDLTTAADRGSTYGILLMGNTLGSCFGPLFGGLISSGFGWRAIFWFLFIVGSCSLILILFFQPETLRKLVGNGKCRQLFNLSPFGFCCSPFNLSPSQAPNQLLR